MSTTEPEELQGEPRWSSIRFAPHPLPAKWSSGIDEKLMLLVTQSTASGERFPVGVNWLEVSRVVRRSPVDCVKRYAYLHDCREQYDAVEEKIQQGNNEMKELDDELGEYFLDSGDDSVHDQLLSTFATPLASPKLQSLDTFGAFVRSIPTSPESSPPFAVAQPDSKQTGTTVAGESPFRWERLVNDPNYTASVIHSAPNVRYKQNNPNRFEVEDEELKVLFSVTSPRLSPEGSISPFGSDDQLGEMGTDSNYPASVLTHAFKGLRLGAMPPPLGSPLIVSPRQSRKISSIEYPFLKEEDISTRDSAASSSLRGTRTYEARPTAAPFLNNVDGADSASTGDLQRQMNAHLLRMSAMSSLHGDNPFSGSITQSALEDAFLDMAGSRLDASNVLLSSRISASPGPPQSPHGGATTSKFTE